MARTASTVMVQGVRSLVTQLYHKRKDLRSEVDSQYSLCHEGGWQLGGVLLFSLFQNMIRQAGEVWIVFDALDECHGRDHGVVSGLLSWIQSLRNASLNIHFLVTSQPKQDIQSPIENWADVETSLIDSGRIRGDIDSYVKARTKQMSRWVLGVVISSIDSQLVRALVPSPGQWESMTEVQKEIEDILVAEADGMFRWVYCQFDTLEDCLDRRPVRRELAALPRDLETTYVRIIQSTPTKHLDYTRWLLQFMTYSERPLRLEEAVDVVAVNPSHKPRFTPVNRMPLPEEVVRYCSSLAVLVKREIKEDGTTITEIQLAHFSVQKYFMSDRLEPGIATDLEMINAKAAIVESGRSNSYVPTGSVLLEHWATYATTVELSRREVAPLARDYFYNVNAHGGYYYTPLQAASSKGHTEIVKLLLDKGAHANTRGGVYGNALRATSSKGHVHIVRMLLRKGADVNSREQWAAPRAGTALYAASSKGHTGVVQLLLNKNAKVDLVGGYFGNALQAASSQGHKEVILMLHKYKATGGLPSAALHFASVAGHTAAVGLLHQNEAKFFLQDEEDQNVYATSSDYENIVQQLLKTDVDVNAQGGYYGTALQAASGRGNQYITKSLLDKGAHVNAHGGVYDTALHGTSWYGHDEVVQLLLDLGANINDRDYYARTPLYVASIEGHEKVVKLLLQRGADVNAADVLKQAPLHAASANGQLEVAKLLLERDVDVNATDNMRQTPLHFASANGHLEVAKLLLEKGADINVARMEATALS
ncbi:ankyrin repeat-containing domain protein [Apiospora saccharicola]|uniref:Ankyrin repeat-containing domain protein n=1 Tax=Apiospora saccharicola TaxID=335842 RepID=A0ABR1U893_9PEZI